jgi:holo-[acyl-carrier protein] synthase
MIVGIGIDIVEIGRFERSIQQYGDRFLRKIFSDREIEYCGSQARYAQHYAARFAAKEATLKALGHGLGMGVSLREIEVVRGGRGDPSLSLTGEARRVAETRGVTKMHVSLSHAETFCVAQVLAEGS